MANPIIQNYLNDQSVPAAKRKGLMDALNSGQANVDTAAQKIVDKYGMKHIPSDVRPKTGILGGFKSGMFGGDVGTGIAKGALSTISGASELGQRGLQALTGIKPQMKSGGPFAVEGGVAKLTPNLTTPKGVGEQVGFAGEQIAEFFAPGALLGRATKGANVINKLPRGYQTLGKAALGAGEFGGVSAIQEGRVDDPKVYTSAALGAAFPVLGALGKAALKPIKKNLPSWLAKGSGLGDDTVTALKDPNISRKAIGMLDDAKAAVKKPTIQSPMQKVGTKQLKKGIKELARKTKSIDDDIVKYLKASNKKATTNEAYNAFVNSLDDLGIKVKNNKLIFKTTSRIKNASDKRKILEVFDDLSKLRNKPTSPSGLHNIRMSIDDVINYSKEGKFADTITPTGEIPLKVARRKLQNTITSTVPKTKPLFKSSTEMKDVLTWFNRKLGENSSSAGVLKNIFSPQAKDQAVPMLNKLSKYTGKDIVSSTEAAKAAMDIVGDTSAKSLLSTTASPKGAILEGLRRLALNPEKSARRLADSVGAPQVGAKSKLPTILKVLLGAT